jgi:hypothetical protein
MNPKLEILKESDVGYEMVVGWWFPSHISDLTSFFAKRHSHT